MSDDEVFKWSRLDRAAHLADQNSLQYERSLQQFNGRLERSMQRAIELATRARSFHEKVASTEARLEFAFNSQVPRIRRSLDATSIIVAQLEKELPVKGEAVKGMQELYRSGRKKARILEGELKWLTMSYIWQVVQTAFLLRRPPRSDQWITNVRLMAYFALAIFTAFVALVFKISRNPIQT